VLRPASRPDRAVRRRAAAVLTTGLLVGSVGGSALLWRSRHITVPLLSETVALTPDGGRTLLVPGDGRSLLPGTRVLRPSSPSDLPSALRLAARQRAWLTAGTVPGTGGPFEPMVRDALLDLRTMTLENGASLAGGPGKWRYVWPRDASFAAVALARSGHPDDAMAVLGYLADLQSWDGRLQARYLPDGSGPPDDRGVQEDGAGWVLWATGQVLAAIPAADRARPPLKVMQLAERTSARILALTQDGTRLPPPSSDYWEVPETSLTLGTVAPMLAGLEAAAAVYSDVGRSAFAGRLTVASIRLRAAVEASFGTRGYPRHVDGDAVDAAVTFVLPPFQQLPLAGAETAWSRATRVMRRPGGGLAPGEGWKQDGISWTPETALFALSAASTGRPAQARAWLRWLAEHRTASGSLPEKVLSNGEPAAVAPLAWTAALVVLTADALDRSAGS
jgi:hypothetical protein